MGVLHRDIKPSNLLIDERLHLWVTDFGLARIRDDPGPTRTGDFLGTLRYTSPEQIRGDHAVVDPRSDVYALGVSLYELLTLQPTFTCDDRQELLHRILNDEPPSPRKIDASIPRDLETIVLKAMAREVADRYRSAQDLAEDLNRFLSDHPIQARRPNVFDHTVKWSRRHRLAIVCASALLMLTLAVSSAMLWRAKQRTDRALADAQAAWIQGRVDFESMLAVNDSVVQSRLVRDRASGRIPDREGQEIYRNLVNIYDQIFAKMSRDPSRSEPAAKAARRRAVYRLMVRDPAADQNYRQAISLYQAIADRKPNFIWIRTALVDTLRDYADGLDTLGRPEDAENALHRALETAEALLVEKDAAQTCFRNEFVVQLDGVARSLVWQPPKRPDDPARAVILARRAVEWEPERAPFWTTLGLAQYRAGDLAAAKASLEKSMSLEDDHDPLNWLVLAMVHEHEGQLEVAQTRFDQARDWFEKNAGKVPQDREIDRIRAEAETVVMSTPLAQ